MPIKLFHSSEFGDLIRACVAGMKRDRGSLEKHLKVREARRNAIRLVVERLDSPKFESLTSNHAETARVAANILQLSRMTTDFRLRFIDRVLSGTRLNLPALLKSETGTEEGRERDYPRSEAHRAIRTAQFEDGSCCIIEDGPFGKTAVWFHKGGVVHRNISDGPALSTRWPNGRRQIEMFMMDGRLHRPSGPAVIEYNAQGDMILNAHFERGLLHRDPRQGPTLRYALSRRGRKFGERHEYHLDGQLHRRPADGPALLEIGLDERCIRYMYFVHGREAAAPEDYLLPDNRGPNTGASRAISRL